MTDVNTLTEAPKRPKFTPCVVADAMRRKDGPSLAQLRSDYRIHVGWGRKYPNLISLSATKDSPLDDPLVRSCHGLVLDMSARYDIVARPPDYFPYFTPPEVPLVTNWGDLLVQERLDGIRYHLYYYRGEWCVGCLTSPDGSDPALVGPTYKSHADLFWEAWHEHAYELPTVSRWGDWCFSWELLTPLKRNVVQHKESELRLVGMRCKNGLELDFNKLPWGEAYGYWLTAREYRFKGMEQLIATFTENKPSEHAGYVLVDPTVYDGEYGFKRFGLLHPGFKHLADLRSGMTIQRALELIRKDPAGIESLLHSFPEWEPEINIVRHRYADAVASLEAGWEAIGQLPDEEFNTRAVGFRMNSVLYEKRKRPEMSIKDLVAGVHTRTLLWGLRLRDAEL